MLEFNEPAILSLHIRDVFFAVLGSTNDFLPIQGKLILPGAVPFCLVFPPKIAFSPTFMCPVMGIHVAALCDQL
jgi:hypothetical protein